jgi:hypothetical protein
MWRVPVQSKLSFMEDLAVLQPTLWNQLDEEEKRNVIEKLARLITKLIVAEEQSGADR